jgi:hypothetical protein
MLNVGVRLIKQQNIVDNKILMSNDDKFIIENKKYEKYILKQNDIILCLVGSIDNKMCIFDSKEKTYLNQNMCKLSKFKIKDGYFYVYSYLFENLKNIFENNCTTSIQNSLSKETLENIQIPVPKDITKLKKPLESLQKLHQQISQDTEAIPAKEKAICDLIKKLTDEGKEGADYDSYKFDDLVDYQKKTIKYKASVGLQKGKYKFYTSSQDKILFIDDEPMFKDTMLIMGRKGDMSCHYDNTFSCEHDNVYVMRVNKVDTRYMYYYVKNNTKWFSDQMNGSTIKGTSKEILARFSVKVLKPKIMSKYKLQELFDSVDKLKTQLEENKIKYQNQMDQLFAKFKDSDDKPKESKQTPTPAKQPESDDESEQEQLDEESESEDESEEIEIKGKTYILEGTQVYHKTKNGTKGELYGTYSPKTGKVKKVSPKEIEV